VAGGTARIEQTRVHKDASIGSTLLFFIQIIIQNLTVLNELAVGKKRTFISNFVLTQAKNVVI
jgi:hypothetical protein